MSLIHQPLGRSMREFCGRSRDSLLLFSPFITNRALAFVLGECVGASVRVITTWSTADIIDGVSDLSIYPELKRRGAQLYLLPDLHMKAGVRDARELYLCTANTTGRGLGLLPRSNIECALVHQLSGKEAAWLAELVNAAYFVDDSLYAAICAHVAEQPNSVVSVQIKEFDLQSWTGNTQDVAYALPLFSTPEEFLEAWRSNKVEERGKLTHDLRLLRLSAWTVQERQPQKLIRDAYFSLPILQRFTKFLKQERYFGEVRRWIVETCFPNAKPANFEATELTRRLYAWTTELAPDSFVVDRPHFSQRIRALC